MSEFKIEIIDNNTGRLWAGITAVTEMSISTIIKDYVTEDATVLVYGADLFCLYWNGKYFFKASMIKYCYLEFFNNVIKVYMIMQETHIIFNTVGLWHCYKVMENPTPLNYLRV